MQLRALWFTKSLQLDSHCLPKFRTQVPGVYLGWVFLVKKKDGTGTSTIRYNSCTDFWLFIFDCFWLKQHAQITAPCLKIWPGRAVFGCWRPQFSANRNRARCMQVRANTISFFPVYVPLHRLSLFASDSRIGHADQNFGPEKLQCKPEQFKRTKYTVGIPTTV